MAIATLDKTEVKIAAPELRGASWEIGSCRDTEVCLDGPSGCVAGETRLYNPITGEHVPIKELYEQKIAPVVQTLIGAIQAEVPFRKGVRKLYRVTLTSGRQCIVTENHIFLTSNGWDFLSSCVPGSRLLISAPCPHPTTEVPGPLLSQQDALRLSQTPLGSQARYSAYSRQDGVPLPSGQGTDLAAAPLSGGALSHSRVDLCEDDRGFLPGYTRHNQQSDHRARSSFSPLPDGMADTLSHDLQGTFSQVATLSRYAAQSLREKYPLLPIAQLQPDGDNMHPHGPLSVEYRDPLRDAIPDDMVSQPPQPSLPCFASAHMIQELPVSVPALDACNLSMSTSNTVLPSTKYNCTSQWDTLSSIEYERTDEYFDLHVPFAEHYLAEGIWHHNTGKTFSILYKIHTLLSVYPGAKWLVSRKYNVDLAGSAMATYQEQVLDPNEGVYYYGGSKVKPPGYIYPNGSFMAVSGLDRPSRLKSFECDGVYINEATEIDVTDLEIARTRLRKGVIPYQQIIMDVNPDAPTHWLNQRMNDGTTTRLLSRHEDNPRYFDAKTNDWTEEGRRYIFGILGGLTGVRLARYRYGIWAAAEGTVYEDSWDRARNVVARETIPLDWPRYLAIDFGYTNPFVCLWAALDPDGRLIIYRQIYKTKTLVEDHAKEIRRVSRWGQEGGDPLPREIICDHDAQGRATLERHLGLFTTPAHKSVLEGIQTVASRFLPAGDGQPRLKIIRGGLVERDQELANAKKPTCLEDEPEMYVWRTGMGVSAKEEPIKEADHALDALRYLCARWDLRPTEVRYSQRIY